MKCGRLLPVLESLAMLASAASIATAATPVDVSAYLGRWDVTLESPDRQYSSWLEITRDNATVQARMVGRWGHARLLPTVEVANGGIRFVSPKEEEGRPDDMVFEGRLEGQVLVGNTSGPDRSSWSWRAARAPSLERTSAPEWGTPVTLFNGRCLSGWHLSDSAAARTWKVENGVLISSGDGADLISDRRFGDFKLHVEFNYEPGSNSGIYLRGRYEVQVEDDPVAEPPERSLGGVYGYLAPSPAAARQPGKWRTYDLTLVGRRVTVVLDGSTLIDDREIPGITGGALDSHEALPGPIVLQGSEDGRVQFRNIIVTPATSD